MVVCNGEIDNHQELRAWLETRGRRVELATDIAVIPGLYLELGDAFVERLVGAFAVAVWDPKQKRVVLARDRAGERSLFFAVQDGAVRFATEIAALASDNALPLSFDRPAISGYLQFGCFVAPTTPFHEIPETCHGRSRDDRRARHATSTLLAMEHRNYAETPSFGGRF